MKYMSTFIFAGLLSASAFAEPTATLSYSYQEADSGNVLESAAQTTWVDSIGNLPSTSKNGPLGVKLVEYVKLVKNGLTQFEKAKCPMPPDPCWIRPNTKPICPVPVDPIKPGLPGPQPKPVPKPPYPVECPEKILATAALAQDLKAWAHDYEITGNKELEELYSLGKKMISNMKKPLPVYPIDRYPGGYGPGKGISTPSLPGAPGGGVNVTAGGAQDFAFFKKLVEDGRVPQSKSLLAEGLLSEYDLSVEQGTCSQLICMNSALTVDRLKNNLFVQLAMGTKITKESFERKNLNLSIVLDISGSMSARDNTDKSRLDWAKESIYTTLKNLNAQDRISIVTFDTNSEVLVPSQLADDTDKVRAAVAALKTRGSTNLESGLRLGFEETRDFWLPGYENRVILISDAGLNTGVTGTNPLVKLVEEFAEGDIGLTAIGLGSNFNQDFVQSISRERGGNYIFVNSGKELFGYFKDFDFLVSPIAYDLKAQLALSGFDAEFTKAYGLNLKDQEESSPLFDINTLFLSSKGGAIILEYQLNN